MAQPITLRDSYAARRRIAGLVRRTAMVRAPSLERADGGAVLLKLEQTQDTGSFKLRGATNAVLALGEAGRAAGVIGFSTGNHGRGLARAAARAGVRCVICMSALVPENKVAAIRAEGAEVRISGQSQDDAEAEVARLAARGMVLIPPFDHRDIIAGQSTVALEMLEDAPDLDTVLVPVSGGGLISGVALVMKAADPAIRVIGVSMERGAALWHSRRAGHPVMVPEEPSLADALGGNLGADNTLTFAMTQALVDDVVTVSEAEIAAAIRHAYAAERQIVEGSGSVGIAALLAGRIPDPGRCAVLLSGQNIDMGLHRRLIGGEDVDIAAETAAGSDRHA